MGVGARRGKRVRDRRPLAARRASAGFASAREIASGTAWSEVDASGLRRLALADAWRRAVGPAVGAVTRISRYARCSLEVDVLDPAWHGNLESLAPRIVERLNQELGASVEGGAGRAKVTSLRFRAPAAGTIAPGGEPRSGSDARSPHCRIAGDPPRGSGGMESDRGPTVDGESLRRRLSEVQRRYPRAKC